jgi:hypothetical protein
MRSGISFNRRSKASVWNSRFISLFQNYAAETVSLFVRGDWVQRISTSVLQLIIIGVLLRVKRNMFIGTLWNSRGIRLQLGTIIAVIVLCFFNLVRSKAKFLVLAFRWSLWCNFYQRNYCGLLGPTWAFNVRSNNPFGSVETGAYDFWILIFRARGNHVQLKMLIL